MNDHDWFAVWVDFVIVVIGVFIGLQVANWNEARQERQRASYYVDRLDREFDVIRERLQGGVDVFGNAVAQIDWLQQLRRDYAANSNIDLPDRTVVFEALSQVGSGRIPATSPATFQEMLASGALESLSSDELRQALYEFDEFAGVARAAWASIRQQHYDASVALVIIVDSRPPKDLAGLLDSTDLGLEMVNVDIETFLNDPAIGGHLNNMMQAQVNQYTLVGRQLQLAERIESLIQAAPQ
ncbi:MAG: hypothetical protein AAGA84_06450 [Pseudomonadota bacterium]